jgi:hypothetical protein
VRPARDGATPLEPAQRLELARDDARAARGLRTALPSSTAGPRKSRFVGLDLLGFGEVRKALGFSEFGEARQRGRSGEALGIEQDEPRGAGPVLAPRGGGEGVADPGDGAPHGAQVDMLAFEAQVAFPARAFVDPLGQRAHEREVAAMELARRGFLHEGVLAPPTGPCQNFHQGRGGGGVSGGSCWRLLARTRWRSSTSSAWATP